MEVYFVEANGRKRLGVVATCQYCGDSFPRRKNKIKRFCSKECRQSASSALFECGCCGKKFRRHNSKSSTKSGFNFCSKICKDTAQRIGGIIVPTHYGASNGREAYKSLIENTANPCCVDCGETKRYVLCIHHIDGNNSNNDPGNWEIVCANCHCKRHLKLLNGRWIHNTSSLTPREMLGKL